jgi:3-phosphoshikimate 1-carboxyvinyltransferase
VINKTYDVTLKGCKLKGKVKVPPSKSLSHRALIAAGLSSGTSVIRNIVLSEDIKATMAAMKHFGATFDLLEEVENRCTYLISNHGAPMEDDGRAVEIFCNESGSTARFLIPFFHLIDRTVVFTGANSLAERPFDPYFDLFDAQGIAYTKSKRGLPLSVRGKLKAGRYEMVGNVSSQFITGLLYILPLLDGDSELVIKPPFESKGYVDLTLEVLSAFGIEIVQMSEHHFYVLGNQSYQSTDFTVEGDYSQAAFFMVANALGSEIELEGLSKDSKQADRIIDEMIKMAFGPANGPTHVPTFDVTDCPDLVPILSVLLALSSGNNEIVGGRRVRIKESDRIKAIASELTKMGASIDETPEGLIFSGVDSLSPAQVYAWNDHRIAMALAIASTCTKGETKILGADCVRKSYPDFWDVFIKLGGDAIVE